MRTFAALATALLTLAVGSVEAHHSISMFDIGKPIWISGTVVRFDAVNPHVMFTLEQQLGDGRVEQWTVEGPSLRAFSLRGREPLQAGEIIEVCGFGLREEVLARNAGGETSERARQAFHGNVLVMSDGRMQTFGGYGKLVNCVRETDEVEAWVTLLNSGARDAWCSSQGFTNFPTVTPQAFIDEVNRRMANPCPSSTER